MRHLIETGRCTNVTLQEIDVKVIRIKGTDTIVYADKPVRTACREHLEREIDDYVDRYAVSPDIYLLDDVEDETIAKTCAVCGAEGFAVLFQEKGR